MQIDLYFSPYTKLISKWIKSLNIKMNILKLIDEKMGNRLEHVGTGENFLDKTPMAQPLRSIIDTWDLMSHCTELA